MSTVSLFGRTLVDAMESTTGLDVIINFRAVFFGFCISAILFGITVRQGYQYFAYTMEQDPFSQIFIAGAVCLLDTLNGIFGMNFVYCYTLQLVGYADSSWHVVWNLKALAVTHVLLILLVQGHYLTQIRLFTRKNRLLKKSYILLAKIYVIIVAILITAISIAFLTQISSINSISSFSFKLQCMLYIGLGMTALLDCTTAAAMCIVLNKCSPEDNLGDRELRRLLHDLVKYIVGTGLMTSFAAIMAIVMYVARPKTMLYLAVEFSVSRLYANSILANFNTRACHRQQVDEPSEWEMEVPRQRRHLDLNPPSSFHQFDFLTDDYQCDSKFGNQSREPAMV